MPSAPNTTEVETSAELAPPAERPRRKLRSTTTAPPCTERLNINIHVTTANALRSMSEAKGITQTETVRRAIAILKLLEEELARGKEIHIVDPADTAKVHVLQLI